MGLGNRHYLPVWEETTGHDLALIFLKDEQQRRASRQRASASTPCSGFSVAPGLGVILPLVAP